MSLVARACVPFLLLALASCSQDAARPTADEPAAGSSRPGLALPTPPPDSAQLDQPGGDGPTEPTTSRVPLAPPPGPAVVRTTPSGPPAPGTLPTIGWDARVRGDAGCPDPRAGAPSYGDLDADGRDEAAVPVACGPDGQDSEVLVYAGDATAARLVGKALSSEQREQVHAVQFREQRLVVTTLAYSSDDRRGERDTAVTTRWVLTSGGDLERTDRWLDPAHVLVTDAE